MLAAQPPHVMLHGPARLVERAHARQQTGRKCPVPNDQLQSQLFMGVLLRCCSRLPKDPSCWLTACQMLQQRAQAPDHLRHRRARRGVLCPTLPARPGVWADCSEGLSDGRDAATCGLQSTTARGSARKQDRSSACTVEEGMLTVRCCCCLSVVVCWAGIPAGATHWMSWQ